MAPLRTIPKSDMEVLSQLIDDEMGTYRIRAGQRVHYVNIKADTFDEDTLCRPYLLIPNLLLFPKDGWTTMDVDRDANGSLKHVTSKEPLPSVTRTWHPKRVDVLSLTQTSRYRSGVQEVLYKGHPAIAKIACFGWQIPQTQRETRAYEHINQQQALETGDLPPLAPAFLAHVTENGRVMGMLIEKVEGRFAGIEDLAVCRKALERLHLMGVVHGDVNRYNFIVDERRNCVRLIDFEHSTPWEEGEADKELISLREELVEGTGRGGELRMAL